MAKKRGERKKAVSKAKVSAGKKKRKAARGAEEAAGKKVHVIDSYKFTSLNMPISVRIYRQEGEFVPMYDLYISTISKTTEVILERIRKELVHKVNLGMVDITQLKKTEAVEEGFSETIKDLVRKYFPDVDEKTAEFLSSYLIQKSLGLGTIEILMDDVNLEAIAINSAEEPV